MESQYDEQEAQTQREGWAVDDALMEKPRWTERATTSRRSGMTTTVEFYHRNFRILTAKAIPESDGEEEVCGMENPDEQIVAWRVWVNEDWAQAVHLRGKHEFTVIKRSEIIAVAGKVTNMNAILPA